VKQRSLTLAVPVVDQEQARIELSRLARDTVVIDGVPQPTVFHGLGIHFARLVLIEEPASSPFRAWLVLESNFDAQDSDARYAIAAHLGELMRKKQAAFAPLLACCAGFSNGLGEAELAARLTDLVLPSTAEYQGHSGRDLGRIALEARLRELCTTALDKLGTQPREPVLLYQQLRAQVKLAIAHEGLELDLDERAPAYPDPGLRSAKLHETWQPWARHGPHALPLLPCLPYVLVREWLDRPYDLQREAELRGPASEARARANGASEDHFAQNALSHLVPVKSGLVRRFVLGTSHRYIAALACHHFNFVEQLGGIPSIHFAKWLLIDGGRRLLFFSNYDGSWESYLGDFVDQAAIGLNLSWSSTEGYPRTHGLAFGGANDEERFKAWARAHQRPTQLFYSAYPMLSVSNINNNTWLRHGLHEAGPSDLSAFLRRLT